ncbi:MAG: hypothetical protein EBR58_09995 [Betaproteobacteria bacterium]|nr:hypothetical protein [Betaproteobacteria bacterium]
MAAGKDLVIVTPQNDLWVLFRTEDQMVAQRVLAVGVDRSDFWIESYLTQEGWIGDSRGFVHAVGSKTDICDHIDRWTLDFCMQIDSDDRDLLLSQGCMRPMKALAVERHAFARWLEHLND